MFSKQIVPKHMIAVKSKIFKEYSIACYFKWMLLFLNLLEYYKIYALQQRKQINFKMY